MWRAACAAVLVLAACFVEIGCGETYRPIAVPLPVTTGNPEGAETEVVLNTTAGVSSVLTTIDVSGDTNAGNKALDNVVGSALENASGNVTGNMGSSIAFDASRTTVYTANTTTDSVTQVLLQTSTAGFAANTTTILLDPGSHPIGMSFEYFGATYTQDYVVNANTGASTAPRTCPVGTGSLAAISQASAELKATICLGTNPVFAWIYTDQSKVFVLDNTANLVDVVSASKYKVTNSIPVGVAPIKATQSTDGSYIFVLNSGGGGSISIIDGQTETVVATVATANALSSALPIDIAQDVQLNRIWVLQADGTVSIFDASIPGALTLVKAVPTTTTVSPTAPPTNLAVMRDGTQAYVGVANTDQIVAINATNFMTTPVTVGVHRTIPQTIGSQNVIVEQTSPMVNYVAVSRDNTKAYATTTTATTYFYYDASGNPTNSVPTPVPAGCTTSTNTISCINLYNGTAVVTAVGNGPTPINTYVTTVPAPSVVTYCDPGNPETGEYDGQKLCPAMVPVQVLGRS
jgi:DNA-binding beta-propeller fold protein YncE